MKNVNMNREWRIKTKNIANVKLRESESHFIPIKLLHYPHQHNTHLYHLYTFIRTPLIQIQTEKLDRLTFLLDRATVV